jgi:hypothetical protein
VKGPVPLLPHTTAFRGSYGQDVPRSEGIRSSIKRLIVLYNILMVSHLYGRELKP